MSEKTVVVALGHKALGATLPEQKQATKAAAKAIADLASYPVLPAKPQTGRRLRQNRLPDGAFLSE